MKAEESLRRCGVVRCRVESCGVVRACGVVRSRACVRSRAESDGQRKTSSKHSYEFMMRRNLHHRMLKNEHFCRTLNETVEM